MLPSIKFSLPILLFLAALISTSPTPASCNWWFISSLSAATTNGGGTDGEGGMNNIGVSSKCDLIPGLSRRQRKLCRRHPAIMEAVAEGVKKGVQECQKQFENRRWNCTTVDQSASFGRILLNLGSREAAFVYAISSAGVVHSIARACASGLAPDCTCLRNAREPGVDSTSGERFEWGGCGDNVDFGASFARRFIDSKEKRTRDGKALMNLHNNRVGRRLVKRRTRIRCKCHGVSGSCELKTCWKVVVDFDDIGTHLFQRYNLARQVTVKPAGQGLIPIEEKQPTIKQKDSPLTAERRYSPTNKYRYSTARRKQLQRDNGKAKLKRGDLVYFELSPDYCERDEATGSLGTAGRRCNVTTTNRQDSCSVLCCGRGYDTKRIYIREKCKCKFVWCCKVECETCIREVDVHTCKPERTHTPSSLQSSTPPPTRSLQNLRRISKPSQKRYLLNGTTRRKHILRYY